MCAITTWTTFIMIPWRNVWENCLRKERKFLLLDNHNTTSVMTKNEASSLCSKHPCFFCIIDDIYQELVTANKENSNIGPISHMFLNSTLLYIRGQRSSRPIITDWLNICDWVLVPPLKTSIDLQLIMMSDAT